MKVLYTCDRFTANVSEVVVVPRLELEVNLEDVSAAIEVAVRRLGYDSPTTQQKEAVTAFVKGNDVFVSRLYNRPLVIWPAPILHTSW